MAILLRRATKADAKHIALLLAELGYPSKEADVCRRLDRFLQGNLSCFLVAQSASEVIGLITAELVPIFQTAPRFAELPVSSSRRTIVTGGSARSWWPARPTLHARIIAQELRSPVPSIVLMRTVSTSGSGFPGPPSDSSRRYEPCL